MSAITQLEKQNRPRSLLFLFSTGIVLLAAGMIFSIKWGQAHVAWRELFDALLFRANAQDKVHLYIQTLRLPRTLMACMVGAALALAGLLTQLATKNPLASPHVFGINAGAALAVVTGLIAISSLSLTGRALFAFAGAALGALLVWSMAGGSGHATSSSSHVKLALAGITVHFLLSALTEGLIILNEYSTDSMIFWLTGSLSHIGWPQVRLFLPFFLGGLLVLACLLPLLRILLLHDEVAAGVGGRVAAVRGASMALVLVLAGSSVAACGPIGFVCLIVPHVARALVGHRAAVLVPMTGLLGGILLVYADMLSRAIAFPFESPVGIVTSAIGGPFFIYLARRRGRAAA